MCVATHGKRGLETKQTRVYGAVRAWIVLMCSTLLSLSSCALRTKTIILVDPAPPEFLWPMEAREIIWFDARDEAVVAVWADGQVTSQSLVGGFARRCLQLPGGLNPREVPISTSFQLNRRGKPLLAFFQFQKLTLFDLDSGRSMPGLHTIPYWDWGSRFGFSESGSVFYLRSQNAILGLGVQDGRIVETIPLFGEDFAMAIDRLLDARVRYQVIDTERGMRAYDKSGTLLWQIAFRNRAEFLDTTDVQPRQALLIVYDTSRRRMMALRVDDGTKTWTLDNVEYDSLRAISDSGERQAFFLQGQMRIGSLPSSLPIPVKMLDFKCDAVFTPDGEYLLCLPALPTDLQSKAGPPYVKRDNSVQIRRESHRLYVVSAKSGEVVRSFDIVPPKG